MFQAESFFLLACQNTFFLRPAWVDSENSFSTGVATGSETCLEDPVNPESRGQMTRSVDILDSG